LLLAVDATALVCGEHSLSYGELNAQANRLAHYLVQHGVRPDMRVGLCVERSLEMVVGLLAILKAGGAYVPLDPGYPPERLAFMMQDSAPHILLTHAAASPALQSACQSMAAAPPMLDLLGDAHLWAGLSPENPDCHSLGLNPRHLAYVIYTSGSTGLPKGVMVEHQNVSNYVAGQGRRPTNTKQRNWIANDLRL
jgi:non-ribosomal peptide synthetase component F